MHAALTLATQTHQRALVRDGFSLLLMIALLGVILITCVTLILLLRRHRLARAPASRGKPAEPSVDPWAEAGRRVAPADELDPDAPDLGPPAG